MKLEHDGANVGYNSIEQFYKDTSGKMCVFLQTMDNGHSIIAGHFTSLTYTQLCFINIKTIFFFFRDVYLY